METTKLTLSLDKEVIEQAKHVARTKGLSLSKYIQAFLESSIKKEKTMIPATGNIPDDIRQLRGILKGQDITKKDIKEAKYEYLKKKYDL